MDNDKIAKNRIDEVEPLLKCYRRCLDDATSLSSRVSEARLKELAKDSSVTILKANKRILGAFFSTSLWKERLYPDGLSYREEDDLLSSFPHVGERIIYLDFLFLDPSFKGKGKGKDLLLTLLHRYEDSSFFLLLKEGDNIPFFAKNGFYPIRETKHGTLFVRPYQKQGICSDPRF
ncbi:MAG: GNAT family N-acetyltransferase [Bacilli bacterium]|nr:GNAT family N-acetyltransferase [Bacilli bacterium]